MVWVMSEWEWIITGCACGMGALLFLTATARGLERAIALNPSIKPQRDTTRGGWADAESEEIESGEGG